MPLTKAELAQIKSLIQDELREPLRIQASVVASVKTNAEAIANGSKVFERLTLITTGDSRLGIPGLVQEVSKLKSDALATQQNLLVTRAKLAGLWIGASTIAVGVARLIWWALSTLLPARK